MNPLLTKGCNHRTNIFTKHSLTLGNRGLFPHSSKGCTSTAEAQDRYEQKKQKERLDDFHRRIIKKISFVINIPLSVAEELLFLHNLKDKTFVFLEKTICESRLCVNNIVMCSLSG